MAHTPLFPAQLRGISGVLSPPRLITRRARRHSGNAAALPTGPSRSARLVSDDDQEPFCLGLLHEVLVFSDAKAVGDFMDCWYEDQHPETIHARLSSFKSSTTSISTSANCFSRPRPARTQASRIEPKNADGYEILGIDVNGLLLEAEFTTLANCDKTTEADDSSEDSDDDVGKLLPASERREDDTKDADFDVSDLLHTAEAVALSSSDEHVDDGEEDIESLITNDELPPPAHLALAHRLLKLSPERLEVLEAIKALCAFILLHNPVLPKELAVVVLVYDVKTRLFQAALAASRRLQEDIDAGLVIPAQRRRGGFGLRKLWRRLFRADDSAAGVYTAVNTAGAVAERLPIPNTSEPATPPSDFLAARAPVFFHGRRNRQVELGASRTFPRELWEGAFDCVGVESGPEATKFEPLWAGGVGFIQGRRNLRTRGATGGVAGTGDGSATASAVLTAVYTPAAESSARNWRRHSFHQHYDGEFLRQYGVVEQNECAESFYGLENLKPLGAEL
ncbi:hypothetical protein HK405_011903 [Cladochytrium tenue]|nr:hypothetical protein HK405_011903 [Cladochytrium tenue]